MATNLPAQVTRFVGREQACNTLTDAVAQKRLITLTGAGGAGKTRLAIEVASRVTDRFRDGVWLVDLAPIADPRLVPLVIGQALNVPRDQEFAQALRDRNLLLILDNCEHLVDACAVLAEALMRTCPAIHLLATSREALGINGESVWRVPPLDYPELRSAIALEELAGYESVALFLDRAIAVQPEFKLTDTNAMAVATVCVRLDGMPLALELAAARLRSLNVEQVARRLSDRFALLTRGSRTALPRHQTLWATLDWSHALLTESERVLFRRLAVFGGGWTLEAAESVCSSTDLAPGAVLDTLDQLVTRSLVVAEERDGQQRYRMLETIGQFASEHLVKANEKALFERRHRDWVLSLVERTPLEAYDALTLALLDQEQDNLRTALTSAIREGDANAALRLSSNSLFWYMRGRYSEGLAWLDDALAMTDSGADPALRARAVCAQGYLACLQGDLDRSEALLSSALRTARELGDDAIRAMALHQLGNVAKVRGALARAEELVAEALRTSRSIGNRNWEAMHLVVLGEVALEAGAFEEAQSHASASLSLAREIGHTWCAARALHFLGRLAAIRGDRAGAAKLLDESLHLQRALGNKQGLVRTLRALAEVAIDRRDSRVAGRYLAEALRVARDIGERVDVAACMADIVALTADHDPQRALSLAESSLRLWDTLGARPYPADRRRLDDLLERIRTHVSESAPVAGQSIESAIGMALDSADACASSEPTIEAEGEPLTPREREVASLIARGLSNREIARILVVTEGTAGNHVQHILEKLGFHTRAQIASWVTAYSVRHPRG